MINPTSVLIAITVGLAVTTWMGQEAWRGLKKIGHHAHCVMTTGHKCVKK